jgi:hypothetical protein
MAALTFVKSVIAQVLVQLAGISGPDKEKLYKIDTWMKILSSDFKERTTDV